MRTPCRLSSPYCRVRLIDLTAMRYQRCPQFKERSEPIRASRSREARIANLSNHAPEIDNSCIGVHCLRIAPQAGSPCQFGASSLRRDFLNESPGLKPTFSADYANVSSRGVSKRLFVECYRRVQILNHCGLRWNPRRTNLSHLLDTQS